jgi:hypothetical protein
MKAEKKQVRWIRTEGSCHENWLLYLSHWSCKQAM